MCLFLQVFRKLELPAESERLSALKTAMLLKRQELIYSINNSRIANLAEWVIARFTPFSTKSATSKKYKNTKSLNFYRPSLNLCVCIIPLGGKCTATLRASSARRGQIGLFRGKYASYKRFIRKPAGSSGQRPLELSASCLFCQYHFNDHRYNLFFRNFAFFQQKKKV